MKRILILCVTVCALVFSAKAINSPVNTCDPWGPWQVAQSTPSLTIYPVTQPTNPVSCCQLLSISVGFYATGNFGLYRRNNCSQQQNYSLDLYLTNFHWSVDTVAIPNSGSANTLNGPYTATFIPRQSGDITFSAEVRPVLDLKTMLGYGYGLGLTNLVVSNSMRISFTVLPLEPMRLGYWHFSDTNWIGEEGQIPYIAANVQYVTNWNDGAVQISSSQSVLGYSAFRDCLPNITRNVGTICFWYCPNWSSGIGSGNPAKLIEMDSVNHNPNWCLSVNSTGNNIILTSKGDADLNTVTNLIRSINWTSNQWYQIVVSYSQSINYVAVYVDGLRLGGHADTPVDEVAGDISGFTIGNGTDGLNPAMGSFDELETFNYILNPAEILYEYHQPQIPQQVLDTDGDGVPDDIDPFPLDPNRWDPINPNDTTPPVIQLLQPITAVQIP